MKYKYIDGLLAANIADKLKQLNNLRPLPVIAVKKLQEQFQIEMTYNSNAIEGNRLSLKETSLVISEGITIKGKPLKDHLEAKNHKEALDYLYDLISDKKRHTVSERLIRMLHQLVVQDTDKEWAGRYRNSNVYITGTSHLPPDASNIANHMQKLVKWFIKAEKKFHPIEFAALFHHKLVHIHPFFDGNGRAARLAMNVLLMQQGYPLVIILKNDRKRYYRVLELADRGKYEELTLFIAAAVRRSLEIYLKTLTPTSKKREKFILLSEAAGGTPYTSKYLNLLLRQGKLEGHKEGRNWLTTKEAVLRYISNRQRKR
ncbi:MAG: Fic family protein [Candidatus Omnitrophica bacterium]|nr:Fic family protein [Candidatus Omnitrophota bacterium]